MPDSIEAKINRKRFSALNLLVRYRTILIILVLVIVFTFINPVFVNPTNLLNMLKRMSFTAITAFGTTFVITLGGLDLSVGSTAAVIGVSLALILGLGIPLPLAILICLIIAIVLGTINGVVAVKGRIEPFLVTLATLYMYRGTALVLTGGRPVPIRNNIFVLVFGNGLVLGIIPTPILFMIIFFILSWFLYKKTKYGFYIRAIGGNLEAARVAGIYIDKVKISTYMINAIFAFFSGLILAALMSSGLPNIAEDLPLDAIAAVILGGTAISGGFGNIWGTLGGTLIMAILASGMALLGAQYPVQILVRGMVIIMALLIDNSLKSRGK